MTDFIFPSRRTLVLLPGIVLLSACAQLDINKDLAEVNQRSQAQTQTRLLVQPLKLDGQAKPVPHSRLDVSPYHAQELSEQQALQLAFTASAQIQSKLANYQQQTLQLAQQGRLLNPRLGLERSHKGAETELARLLSFSVIDLLSLPERRNWVQQALAETQTQFVGDLIAHSLQVRQRWLQAIATEAESHLLQETAQLIEAAAELAQNMRAAGNFSQQQADRFAATEAEFKAQLWAAKLRQAQSRAQFAALIGWPQHELAQLKLASHLADLPPQSLSLPDLNAGFLSQRLDVQSSALRLKQALSVAKLALPASLGEVELGLRHERSQAAGGVADSKRGIELSFSLPIFNWGSETRQASVVASQAAAWSYQQRLQDAGYQVAQAYQDYLTYYEIARHYQQQVIPVRQRLAQQSLLRYNGMLISVFELLDEVKLRLQAEITQQQNLLNFHLSELKLQAAIHGVNLTGVGQGADASYANPDTATAASSAAHN